MTRESHERALDEGADIYAEITAKERRIAELEAEVGQWKEANSRNRELVDQFKGPAASTAYWITKAKAAKAREVKLREALEFYADPDTYFAVSIISDPPAGDIVRDFSAVPGNDYDRPMPGKRARAALDPQEAGDA